MDFDFLTLIATLPALLGFVHKRILGGVTGLVTGGPIAAVGGFLSGGQQAPQAPMPINGGPVGYPMPGSGLAATDCPPGSFRLPGTNQCVGPGSIPQFPVGLPISPTAPSPNGATGAWATGTQLACPAGYRPNKTSYFTKSQGYIEAGTKCVKIRRRNPLNPRALDRALGRITSAKRAASKLSRVTVRKKKC